MRVTRWTNAVLCAMALSGCPAESHEGDGGLEPGPQPAPAPAPRDIFRDIDGDGLVGDPFQVGETMTGEPIYETRYLFDDARLHELCVLPDADSFDDYEERDGNGRVIIPRGTTPLSMDCPADGVVTGPLHDELEPSSWCRIEDCTPEEHSD